MKRKDSIQSRGGLAVHLNNPKKIHRHNGYDWHDLYCFINVVFPPSIKDLAFLFGVSRHTMRNYLQQYVREYEQSL